MKGLILESVMMAASIDGNWVGENSRYFIMAKR